MQFLGLDKNELVIQLPMATFIVGTVFCNILIGAEFQDMAIKAIDDETLLFCYAHQTILSKFSINDVCVLAALVLLGYQHFFIVNRST